MPNTEFDDEFSEANVLLGDKIGHVRRHYFWMLDAYEKKIHSTVAAVGVATAEGRRWSYQEVSRSARLMFLRIHVLRTI